MGALVGLIRTPHPIKFVGVLLRGHYKNYTRKGVLVL
jgi:hypothetical protein